VVAALAALTWLVILGAPAAHAQDSTTTTTTTVDCSADPANLACDPDCPPDPAIVPVGSTQTSDGVCGESGSTGGGTGGSGGNGFRDDFQPSSSGSSGSSSGGSAGGTSTGTTTTTASSDASTGSHHSHFTAHVGSLPPLPDPLPPGSRLDADFASHLKRIAHNHSVNWGVLLAVLRAEGKIGSSPATPDELRALAERIAALTSSHGSRHEQRISAIRAIFGDGELTDRTIALADFHRAVGLRGLVRGLDAVQASLGERVLTSRHISVYGGGSADIAAGRVDSRVLTVILYLSQRWDDVSVTSLISGHPIYVKGTHSVSLHVYGRAVDISSLDGTPIAGHQQPGGITERALRKILLLPATLQPSELISLFDLGGPSFARADHADHIHVGF
jgi:hypothetical protein